MALARTTTSGAIGTSDTEILLASIAGVLVGSQLNIDGESMRVVYTGLTAANPVGVYRGLRGTNVATHPAGANVVVGAPSDFSTQARTKPTRRDVVSYSVAGAIANPNPGKDMVAVINGASALAMTLANPSKDNEGDVLLIASNGKAAHTVTYTTAGLGGRGASVITFSTAAAMTVELIALAEVWNLVGSGSGAGAVAASPVIT